MDRQFAQGSITIKRLRNGDTIFLTFELNGKPLYQSVDDQIGTVVPDWTLPANQPIITPRVSATTGKNISLGQHQWAYNNVTLLFIGEEDGEWRKDTTNKFAINQITGALKIIDNLASIINIANDVLTYSGVVSIAGIEYNIHKSIEVQIVKGGGNSYYGFIDADTTQLDENYTEAHLQTSLYLAGNTISDYYVRWYKDNTEWEEMKGHKNITITREDVNGSQLFIAQFYLNEGDENPVDGDGITIIDTKDEILLVPYISSVNKEVDINKPVTVQARIIKASDGSVITPTNPIWSFQVYEGTGWTLIKEAETSSIDITTDETDLEDGTYRDVEVSVEVEFESLN